jgi:lysophospholipase L1-like esterase
MCEIIDEIAHFVSAPVIDANGDCGINGVNFSNYQTDGVHPNLDGRKMFGRVFVGDLIKFANKIQ